MPSHVVQTASNMIRLLAEFSDIITHFKVTSPRGQATRPDSIVVYLNQANIDRAGELAAQLSSIATPAALAPGIPLGMHPLRTGIAYGEFTRNAASGSLGEDRALMLVDALIHCLDHRTLLQTELENVILARGYSLDNPALVART